MKRTKLKIFLEDGTYFWAEVSEENMEAHFNGEPYYLIDKNGYNLKFKAASSKDTIDFKISKNNNKNVILHIILNQ